MSLVNSVIHPSPQLCTCCASLQWPSMPFDKEGLGEELPLQTSKSLQNSADQGCALCRFVWSNLVYNRGMTNDVKRSLADVPIILKLLMLEISSIIVIFKVELDGQTTWCGAVTTFNMVDFSEVELLKGGMESRQVKAFTADNMQKDLQELIERQIEPWMEACYNQGEYHERCMKKHDTTSLPTRLVDVGQMGDDMVKLVTIKSSANAGGFAYLILSYCWGAGNANSLTTKENVTKRMQGFSISKLPKTIQDSILLTRMMGFRYLWIDAICIIQGTSGDFHAESPRMGDYYSNSACCIAASCSNDSSEGFLIERPVARYPITHIGIRIADHSRDGTPYRTYQEVDNSNYVKKPFLDSPLTKRGWCWQELALPSRILHWTPQGLFLECSSSLFLEDTKTPWQDLEWIKESTSRLILAMPDETVLFFEGWYQLVALFSHAQLTYEKDRLYAIHGLASVLIRRTKSQYFNGVFRKSLAQGLLWHHRSDPGEYNGEENSHLPSWCWAYVCPVDFIHIHETPIYIKDDHPGQPLEHPTTFKNLNTVESSVSRLYIRAHIVQLTVEKKEDGDIREKYSDKRCMWLEDRGSKAAQIPVSLTGLFQYGGERDILWMPVGRVVKTNLVVGLLIYKLIQEGRVVYVRYGTLQTEWAWNERVSGDLQEIILV